MMVIDHDIDYDYGYGDDDDDYGYGDDDDDVKSTFASNVLDLCQMQSAAIIYMYAHKICCYFHMYLFDERFDKQTHKLRN